MDQELNDTLIQQIRELAGPQRADSFTMAAKWILEHAEDVNLIVETGSYRGNNGDGQSTLIFALLAKEVGADFISVDLDAGHTQLAKEHLTPEMLNRTTLVTDDSVLFLSQLQRRVDFLYLDSVDFDRGAPITSQSHQIAEFGAVFGKLSEHCGILLDDRILPSGGKTGLSAPFIEAHGFKKQFEDYQILFIR